MVPERGPSSRTNLGAANETRFGLNRWWNRHPVGGFLPVQMGHTSSRRGSASGTTVLVTGSPCSCGIRASAAWNRSISMPPAIARTTAITERTLVHRPLSASRAATGIIAKGISGKSRRGPVDQPPVHSG